MCGRRTCHSFTKPSSLTPLNGHLLPFISNLHSHIVLLRPFLFLHPRLMLNTHTSNDVPNFLMLTDVVLLTGTLEFVIDGKSKNFVIPKVEITQKIQVDGEVNKARCIPQNPKIISAKPSDCEVYVLDTLKQVEKKHQGCDPKLRLRDHDKEGYSLSWNPFKQGYHSIHPTTVDPVPDIVIDVTSRVPT